jgi:hypothetical protein
MLKFEKNGKKVMEMNDDGEVTIHDESLKGLKETTVKDEDDERATEE